MTGAKKYGIISDIHSNWPAYSVAMEHLDSLGVNRVLCLGDLVGYGGSPFEVIQDIKSRKNMIVIGGNHDRQVLGDRDPHMRNTAAKVLEWTRQNLPPSYVQYLSKLPQGLIVDENLILVHGSLVERDAYILSAMEVKRNRECLRRDFPQIQICMFGHTHIPMLISTQTILVDLKRTRSFKLDPNDKYMINPGSVGQPRDRCPLCSFAVLDMEREVITFYRKPYDYKRAQRTILDNKLPERFARRLAIGM